jgi:hypothetical protein
MSSQSKAFIRSSDAIFLPAVPSIPRLPFRYLRDGTDDSAKAEIQRFGMVGNEMAFDVLKKMC